MGDGRGTGQGMYVRVLRGSNRTVPASAAVAHVVNSFWTGVIVIDYEAQFAKMKSLLPQSPRSVQAQHGPAQPNIPTG
jgi:hypothetical protein